MLLLLFIGDATGTTTSLDVTSPETLGSSTGTTSSLAAASLVTSFVLLVLVRVLGSPQNWVQHRQESHCYSDCHCDIASICAQAYVTRTICSSFKFTRCWLAFIHKLYQEGNSVETVPVYQKKFHYPWPRRSPHMSNASVVNIGIIKYSQ